MVKKIIIKKIITLNLLFLMVILVSISASSLIPISKKSDVSYNPQIKEVTDNNGLTYKSNINGVVTINDERYLAFAIKAKVNGNEVIKTSMDFNWNWHHVETEDGHIIWAENNNEYFVWKQYYYFYNDKPMKIKNYLENNYADLTDVTFYYLTDVQENDKIEFNEIQYLVEDFIPLHLKNNLNNIIPNINFNSLYEFKYQDLIDNGFDIDEFYIGSGFVIGIPNTNIMAIGFTKNNGYFPKGSSVIIDPMFSSRDIKAMSTASLDETSFVIAYCDGVGNDVYFQTWNTNGFIIHNETLVEADVYDCGDGGISVSALNSSDFVIAYTDYAEQDLNFVVYDINGNLKTGEIIVDDDIYYNVRRYAVSVSALNNTAFIVSWSDDTLYTEDSLKAAVYNVNGSIITDAFNVRNETSPSYVKTTAFDSRTFGIVYMIINGEDYVIYRTYDLDGTPVSDNTLVASSALSSKIDISSINSTETLISYYKDSAHEYYYKIFDVNGVEKLNATLVTATSVTSGAHAVSTINTNKFAYVYAESTLYDDYIGKILTFNGENETKIVIENSTSDLGGIIEVTSRELVTNTNLCENTFLVSWVKDGNEAYWEVYYLNGSNWDGTCPETSQTTPSTPTTFFCDEGSCNGTFAVNLQIGCSGSVDNESDTITYKIELGNSTGGGTDWFEIGNHTEGSAFNWDISGEAIGEVYESIRCKAIDLDGSGNYSIYYSENIALEIGEYASETEGRTAIETTSNEELSSPEIYSDVVVYVVYQNGTHSLGTYDKVVKEGDQRWMFNYLSDSDAKQILNSISVILNFWENVNMTISNIETSVGAFIAATDN